MNISRTKKWRTNNTYNFILYNMHNCIKKCIIKKINFYMYGLLTVSRIINRLLRAGSVLLHKPVSHSISVWSPDHCYLLINKFGTPINSCKLNSFSQSHRLLINKPWIQHAIPSPMIVDTTSAHWYGYSRRSWQNTYNIELHHGEDVYC